MTKKETKYLMDASVSFVSKVIKEKHPDINVLGAMLKTVLSAAGVKNPEITYETKEFLGKTFEMLVIKSNDAKSIYYLGMQH